MFHLREVLLNRAIKVLVVGVGGSGSHVAADLAVLHGVMLDLGHPEGLEVTLVDEEVVADANVGRARFYQCDVGLPKADVMAHRINLCHGTRFRAVHGRVEDLDMRGRGLDVVIGCVDTRASRRSIHAMLCDGYQETMWLDLGNGSEDGQVILGTTKERKGMRLPTIVDLYPEMLDPAMDPVTDQPSCSRAESIARQGVFVNKSAALHAVGMLSNLVRHGSIDYSGVFFNVRTGRVGPLRCDPKDWERFGYTGGSFERRGLELAE